MMRGIRRDMKEKKRRRRGEEGEEDGDVPENRSERHIRSGQRSARCSGLDNRHAAQSQSVERNK